jgi:NTP pyrophosphatase (non-canonical NTP hydrolase)
METDKKDYARGGTELEDPIGPEIGRGGIGWCTGACPHRDGDLCRLTGFRPESICEPWAERLVRERNRLNDMAANLGLVSMIERYYEARAYFWPDAEEAILWTITELGEACELLLARKQGWVRNRPDGKEEYSRGRFEEELGDAIMMLLVAGIVSDVDPLVALREKMKRRLNSDG